MEQVKKHGEEEKAPKGAAPQVESAIDKIDLKKFHKEPEHKPTKYRCICNDPMCRIGPFYDATDGVRHSNHQMVGEDIARDCGCWDSPKTRS